MEDRSREQDSGDRSREEDSGDRRQWRHARKPKESKHRTLLDQSEGKESCKDEI